MTTANLTVAQLKGAIANLDDATPVVVVINAEDGAQDGDVLDVETISTNHPVLRDTLVIVATMEVS